MVNYYRAGNANGIVVQFLDNTGRKQEEIIRLYWDLDEIGVNQISECTIWQLLTKVLAPASVETLLGP